MPSHAFLCKSFIAKSNCHLRFVAANRPSPINALEQHRKLCLAERYRSARRLRPDESPAFQSLREQAQTVARPPQQLDQISAATTKDEHVTRKWVFLEYVLHHPAQPRKTSPQIGHSRCDPAGSPIILPSTPTPHVTLAHRPRQQPVPSLFQL